MYAPWWTQKTMNAPETFGASRQGIGQTEHWHCCSQRGTFCRPRLADRGWNWLYTLLVREDKRKASPFRCWFHDEDTDSQQTTEFAYRTFLSTHVFPPPHTKQQVCYRHQRLCSNPSDRRWSEGGFLQWPAQPPPASQIRRQSPHTWGLQRESGTRLQRVDRRPGQTRCRKLQR